MPRSQILAVVGVLIVALGLFWTSQGLGIVGGGAMSGHVIWAVIGPLVALLGAGMLVTGLRRSRSR